MRDNAASIEMFSSVNAMEKIFRMANSNKQAVIATFVIQAIFLIELDFFSKFIWCPFGGLLEYCQSNTAAYLDKK